MGNRDVAVLWSVHHNHIVLSSNALLRGIWDIVIAIQGTHTVFI